MGKPAKVLFIVAGISLFLNFVWENLQAPLYQGYSNFWQHLPICSIASLGDVLIILLLYFILAIFNKDIYWITKMSKIDILTVIFLGMLVAVGIEKPKSGATSLRTRRSFFLSTHFSNSVHVYTIAKWQPR